MDDAEPVLRRPVRQENLLAVSNLHELPADLPAPVDDGAAAHLPGAVLPDVELPDTSGGAVALARLTGWTVLYVYPKTGRPGTPLPEGWDGIPGARGCTPQACAFRDHGAELDALGVTVYGLSTQPTAEQREARERLHLPFELLSDSTLQFHRALGLPTFTAGGEELYKRLTLICEARQIRKVFYPVFPPDRNAADAVAWLRSRRVE